MSPMGWSNSLTNNWIPVISANQIDQYHKNQAQTKYFLIYKY